MIDINVSTHMYKGKGDSTMRKWTALLCLILALCLLGGCTTQQEKAKVPISWYLRTDMSTSTIRSKAFR